MAKVVINADITEIDVLRARAVAAAMLAARPKDYITNAEARVAWYECCRQLCPVVCTASGVNYVQFYNLCGVPD